ncbi:Sodium/hydrogen exchanger family-domain-containing protein [Phakopsora pachyrhizi]|uniref:Sodium/hydrogen exchanger family-domain-containing protein n=1 Tax=Phakopsora pachyrhizi TaxID=170000 RepID=A0AAV0BCI9_PHAPC|nr:Sodium/hydrogen exchanger family-domain-containing protein [Phakopsora pachyrhizi]CAH7683973.1 Sodium/hydrogen exchanger family-domain-containing protein [Phakopsora pachyrhizi]
MRFGSILNAKLLGAPLLLFISLVACTPTSDVAIDVSSLSSNSRFHPTFLQIIRRRPALEKRNSTSKRTTSVNHTHYSNILASSELGNDIETNSLSSGEGTLGHSHEELFKIVTEATPTHLALSLLPAFMVIFGLFSAFVKERLYIGEAILAVAFGIILGPYVSGVFDPRSWNEGVGFDDMTLEVTRVVIALSVFAVGVELPKAYILRHWLSLAYLLGPIMLVGWLISGALIYVLIPALNFLQSLVVAAAVTPTDPILAASVVGKGKYAQKHVPAHLRHLLQAESGCNDGAAFPFLYLAMFILLREESSVGRAIGSWFLLVILYQILLGILIGTVIGVAARKTLKFCKRRSMIDRESMVAMYVALALLTTGLTTLAGSDDLLAAFACGAAFAWDDWFTESIEASNFSSIIDLLINCAVFIYVGATIPFAAWNDPNLTLVPWRLILLGISILVLRRLPAMLALQRLIPDLKTNREAVFCGHFGPIGVGAIFISTLAASKLPTPAIPPQSSLDILALTVQPLIYLIVLFSIFVHGLSIPFFTLGRSVHSRVHSMTKTWTQASGNEPTWLSRVKRVDRTNGSNSGDFRGEDQPLSVVQPENHNDQLIQVERGEKHGSDDQTTRVEDEGSPGQEAQESNVLQLSNEVSDLNQRLLSPDFPSPPPPTRNRTEPIMSSVIPTGIIARSGLLRLTSTPKMTAEEQEARRRNKLLRDDWCRRERIDITKKDEERVYKSGRHVIIERGDGDVVEVRRDPFVEATSRDGSNRKLNPFASNGGWPVGKSPTFASGSNTPYLAAARKLGAAKSIVHRFKKKKSNDCLKESTLDCSSFNQSLQEPPQVDAEPILRAGCESSFPRDFAADSETPAEDQIEYEWPEGSKLVTENEIGEVVRVEPNSCRRLRNMQSLPTLPLSAIVHSPKPPQENNFSLPDLNKPATFQGLDIPWNEEEWEEDERSESDFRYTRTKPSRRALSRTARRRPSSRVSRRPRHVGKSSQSRFSNAEGIISSTSRTDISARSPPAREVGFAGLTSERDFPNLHSGKNLSRSSSPARSIRFADHLVRPRETRSSKHGSRKRNRNSLLRLVTTRKSSQPSSIVTDETEQGGDSEAMVS